MIALQSISDAEEVTIAETAVSTLQELLCIENVWSKQLV